MKPGVPWSVKGIEPDVREAAKLAARRSGMTLGEWLNSKIIESADDAPDAQSSAMIPRMQPSSGSTLERTASRLEDIAEQLSRLSRRETETAQHVSAPQHRMSEDGESFRKIMSRVESNERQTVEAFTAVNDRLSVLGRQFAQAVKARENKPEDTQAFTTLEKAMRNIVEHVETSEKRTRENFKSLQDRMTSLTQKAASAPGDSLNKQAPAFSQLEARLADLAQRVERSENSAGQVSTLPDLLKKELTQLAGRIDTVRDTAEQLATRAQTQAVQSSQQELRAIESRIVGLIKEAQSSLTNNVASPSEMQRMRGEIERLHARIDEASDGSSNGDVLALKAAVEQLSTRVAQGPDMRPLADMDRRILDITQRLEQTQAQTRNMPQFSELERRMAELDFKLNEAVAGRGASQSEEIEERLSDIASRVTRTEQQLGSMETIERAVNQLFDSMEQQRNWTQDVADQAANRMAQQVIAQMPQQMSLAGAPEIQALQDGLSAVRAATEAAEGRNQETLEAVHETLEQIVGKLSELETAAIGQRVAAAMGVAPAVATAAAPAFAEPEVFQQDFVVEQPVQEQSWQPEPQPIEAPQGNPFEPLAPQEPGFDPLSSEPAAPANNPFEPVLEMPPFTPHQPEQDTAGSDDFIAAARRAAQVASQPKSVLTGLSPGAARASEEASKKLLGFGLFKRREKNKPAVSTLVGELKPPPGFKQPAANTNVASKRKYILMGIVLLAAVSAFTFNMLGQTRNANVPVAPTPIEQKLDQSAPIKKDDTSINGSAQPPQQKPAELQSQLIPEDADPVLTSSLEKPSSEAISSIVSGNANNVDGIAPAEAGSLQLREAAALGNVDAQFVIATRYLNGQDGVTQDAAKAAYWYGKAAAAGSAPAQYRLGTLYERGKGVARDMKAALGWYERAAALGNVKAMHNAAVLAAGSGLDKPDYVRAFKWFSLGAAHGLKDSQFNLAVLLERGLGTKANPKEALFWYSVAAKQSDADADKRAASLAATLPTGDLQETEKRLRLWKAETAPEVANSVAVTDPNWQASAPDAS
jgi:localization factor PodJL